MNKNITLNDLEKKVNSYNKVEWPMVLKAYNFANERHKGQKRASGEDYIVHPLTVCYMLAEMRADRDTLIAALLHDVVEDTGVTLETLTKEFNKTVAYLVDGVTKMNKMNLISQDEVTAVNVRKVIVSIREDARIIIIKLMDRLHNMRTLEYKSVDRQQVIALETLEIYVPMAFYIGAYNIKTELENLSFKYLKPNEYHDLNKKLFNIQKETKKMISSMVNDVKQKLNNEGIKSTITVNYKESYSVYKKISKSNTIDNIHDLISIKVVCKTVKECYIALMIIHSLYPPFCSKFKDFITNPKTNMYQSLHTTVFNGNRLVQFQIRTKEMDRLATYGLTSYWFKNKGYAGQRMQEDLENKFQFFKSIKELDSTVKDSIEFVNKVKTEIFSKNVYVKTTNGETIELPLGSTPIDFAYKIHTDIGNSMIAAIVNDEVVPFDYKLKSNDRVRIVTDESVVVPKNDWLSIAVTSAAKRKITDNLKDKETSK